MLSPSATSKANVVHVLDSKRSLAINIMLKQFKTGENEILEALKNGTSIPLEKLKGLQRVLPTDEEVFRYYFIMNRTIGDNNTAFFVSCN